MVLERAGNLIFQMPEFVHKWGKDNDSEDPEDHFYRGSFFKHRAVERILLWIRHNFLNELLGDASPFYEVLDSFIGIFLGLNCGYPSRDVMLYTVWRLRGCKALRVWRRGLEGWVIQS